MARLVVTRIRLNGRHVPVLHSILEAIAFASSIGLIVGVVDVDQ